MTDDLIKRLRLGADYAWDAEPMFKAADRIAAVEAERDRQYDYNVGQIKYITTLEGELATAKAAKVTVKPLEWKMRGDFLFAETIGGELWVAAGLDTSQAQSKHEARILSTITLTPTPVASPQPAPAVKPDPVAKAARVLLADAKAFAVMVEVAEDTAAKNVSFNVVIGRALRAIAEAQP